MISKERAKVGHHLASCHSYRRRLSAFRAGDPVYVRELYACKRPCRLTKSPCRRKRCDQACRRQICRDCDTAALPRTSPEVIAGVLDCSRPWHEQIRWRRSPNLSNHGRVSSVALYSRWLPMKAYLPEALQATGHNPLV
jgi:hypothetical protein